MLCADVKRPYEVELRFPRGAKVTFKREYGKGYPESGDRINPTIPEGTKAIIISASCTDPYSSSFAYASVPGQEKVGFYG